MTTSKDYKAITSLDELKRVVASMIAAGKPIGFDTETGYYGADFPKRSLDHYNDKQFCVGFSFSNDHSWARYVPLAHDGEGNIDAPASEVWEVMRPMLENCHIVSYHQKFERAVVAKAAGIDLTVNGRMDDPMLAAYVLGRYHNSIWRTIVGLKELVTTLYDHPMMEIQDLWEQKLTGKAKERMRFNTLPVTPKVVAYACEDAAWMLPLYDDICIPAQRENSFMYNLEHKIANMMVEVERYGVTVDWEGIREAHAQAQTFVPHMEQFVKDELGKLAGRDISDLNLNSVPQKKKLLFKDIGFSTTRLTKKAQSGDAEDMEDWQKMSTDKRALEGLAKEYPAVRNLLEYGEVQNLTRRLKKWMAEYTHSVDGRVHATYNQVQVPSGRFAANEPAIQQLPKKWLWIADDIDFDLDKDDDAVAAYKATHTNGEEFWAGNYRNFIVASEGHYLITFDFSQAELRVLAGASQEPALLEAFANDDDVHAATASMIFGVPIDEVTYEQRQRGKTTNFAILYGQGPKALGESLGISFNEAKALYQQYFSALSNVTLWYNAAKQRGFAENATKTIFGRRVPIWELKSDVSGTRAKGERVIINSEIQGGVADYVKVVMLKARKKLIDEGLWDNGVMMTMNQHDALTFEIRNDIDPNVIRDMLQPVVVLDNRLVPPLANYPAFVADWEIGLRWGSSQKWDLSKKAVWLDGVWQVEPDKELAHFTLEVSYAPTETEFRSLVKALKDNPGSTHCRFICPGADIEFPFTAKLTEKDARKLSKAFKDARIETQ